MFCDECYQDINLLIFLASKFYATKTLYLKDYRPADFQIENVHLHFDLHEENTVVKSVLKIKRNPAAETPNAPLVLNGEEMTLQAVSIDGKTRSVDQFQVDDQHLSIRMCLMSLFWRQKC